MKQGMNLIISTSIVALLAASGGYWWGSQATVSHDNNDTAITAAATRIVGNNGEQKGRKILYYRNPMGLPDVSSVPKKDPMGMDYVPVYEGEESNEPVSNNQIKISTDKVQKLGVRTELAQLRKLNTVIQAAGRIEVDERRIYTIAAKFEGYIERLYVNVTGQPVSKGQVLFDVYSPDLVSAQREYVIAAQGVESLKQASNQARTDMQLLADSSLQRLKNWDISEAQIKALSKSGETKRIMAFRSPVAGVITQKTIRQGVRFMPGESLYQVADLSSVWVVADVFEQDIDRVKIGAKATIHINAYPSKRFEGTVTYVYPTLQAETRTVSVRVELTNPGLLLKPAMFAQVELSTAGKGAVVTVPMSAVIDSGSRQIVLVQQGEGRFESREVKLGVRSDNDVEIIEGVRKDEPVVVAANFLIDAESNLRAAVNSFGHSEPIAAPKTAQAPHQGIDHHAQGTVDSVDVQTGTVNISHGPIDSLKWPAMTMEFKLSNTSLLPILKSGIKINFDFVERQPGEWVITAIKSQE